jgi:site-specific DNA-cytosine methylase
LEAVTGPAGRMLAGQGMDVDVVAAILRRELPELAHGAGGGGSASSRRTLHFADLFSGISFAAAAALKLRPSASRFGFAGTGRLRYRVACDAVSNVLKAHQGGWAGWVERVVQFAHSQEAVEAMRAAAPLDVAVAGIRCAPWSQAKTTSDPKDPGFKGVRERCLEESCQAIRALVAGEPRLIVLETSDWLLKGARKQYWRRLAVHLQSFVDYRWSYQVVCPRVHFSKWVPRSRLYVVGRRV